MNKRMSRKNVDSDVLEQMYAAIGGSDAFCKYFSSKKMKKAAAAADQATKKKMMAGAILEHLFVCVDGKTRRSCYLTYVQLMEDAEHFNDACGATPAELSSLIGWGDAANNFKMKKWPSLLVVKEEKLKKGGVLGEEVKKLMKVMKWKELGVLLLKPQHQEEKWDMHVLTVAVLAKRILVKNESGRSAEVEEYARAMRVLDLAKQWLAASSCASSS